MDYIFMHILQVMQFTSVTADDAMVALHDCDNDVNAAIDSLLEGDDQGKWQESTKKKKKPITGKVRIISLDIDSCIQYGIFYYSYTHYLLFLRYIGQSF